MWPFLYENCPKLQPFPMNPLFRPSAPIKDVTKEQIYKQHISDPKTNTARKLAMKYNISIARVEAILKSKNLERDLLNRGAVLQTDFQAGMERLLCANRLQPITEATSTEATGAEPPYLMTVEENTVFRHQDAIQLLGLPQRKKQSKNKSVAAMTPQERERSRKDAEEENRVVSKDLDEVNRRFKFMFTDTTKGEKVRGSFTL
ncbi:eukaryotic mitochondrial regulator protein-domain-containing protein [Paraphysoderma sedebokerense]|nr:eukaryotic mitochondrial regulator protein-domain-containing protein [Paraphysoderma sedebokerense]